jgi:phosphoserine phosphatase
MSIEIFDLDGTLTEEFSPTIGDKTKTGIETYSYWNLITRELVTDKNEFDAKSSAWKKMVTSAESIDKIESSKDMTEIGLQLFRQENRNADVMQKTATEITKLFFKYGVIVTEAIEYIAYRLKQNVTCVISTASYEDGAKGFINGLAICGLIAPELAAKIIISGTIGRD